VVGTRQFKERCKKTNGNHGVTFHSIIFLAPCLMKITSPNKKMLEVYILMSRRKKLVRN